MNAFQVRAGVAELLLGETITREWTGVIVYPALVCPACATTQQRIVEYSWRCDDAACETCGTGQQFDNLRLHVWQVYWCAACAAPVAEGVVHVAKSGSKRCTVNAVS